MLISVKSATRLLNVTGETIYRWIKQDIIPFIKVNDEYFFNRLELLEWATAAGLPISTELFAKMKPNNDPLTDLYDALKAGGVFYKITGNNQAAVLKSIVANLKLPEDADRNFLYQVLLARETLGSTGIGNGIAIPHVRNPVVLHITHPSVTLCFLENPIDFKAVDGKPVHILFTIISPSVNLHLHLLSRLSYILNKQEVRSALDRQAPEQELLNLIAHIESELIINKGRKDPNTVSPY